VFLPFLRSSFVRSPDSQEARSGVDPVERFGGTGSGQFIDALQVIQALGRVRSPMRPRHGSFCEKVASSRATNYRTNLTILPRLRFPFLGRAEERVAKLAGSLKAKHPINWTKEDGLVFDLSLSCSPSCWIAPYSRSLDCSNAVLCTPPPPKGFARLCNRLSKISHVCSVSSVRSVMIRSVICGIACRVQMQAYMLSRSEKEPKADTLSDVPKNR